MGVLAEVGERLIRFRAAAGLEPERAAEMAQVDPDRLDRAEIGDLALDEDELARVAGTYGVDPTEIFGGRITPVRDFAAGG
ncbi:MAG: helix-turn-helix transcriptional regulator [Candidatus Elarobacter sp.]